jgi:hypothetical protein
VVLDGRDWWQRAAVRERRCTSLSFAYGGSSSKFSQGARYDAHVQPSFHMEGRSSSCGRLPPEANAPQAAAISSVCRPRNCARTRVSVS